MGDILVSGNLIHSDDKGIYAYNFEYFGEDLYDNSTWTMGNIQFNSNTIHSVGEGIYVYYFTYFGDYMAGNASFTMGNIEFSGNTINSTLDGIYFYQIYDIADGMYGNSTFTMGNFSVNDNIITSGNDGIHLNYLEPFGLTVYDNATFTMDNLEFSRNTISNCNTGMNFTDLLNATIMNNRIQDCSYGIYLLNSNNSLIYHNLFNNTVNAYDNGTNTWDNGYPSGGNYWSDYNGTDLNSGPGQNITGSDGIGDTPYDIQIGNQDGYPFMTTWAWDQTPPSISGISQDPTAPDDGETVTITVVVTDAESGVYNVTLSYSTDGGENWINVPMQKTTGNTYQAEIPGLLMGTQVQYKIIAYDKAGNPAVEDNAGSYYIYTVIPEFPSVIILPLFMLLALIAVALAKKNRCQE
jgi:parallel beta-helix repeat protein